MDGTSTEWDKSKTTFKSLLLFNYLIASKHKISYLLTSKSLRSHFFSIFELFQDAHIQREERRKRPAN